MSETTDQRANKPWEDPFEDLEDSPWDDPYESSFYCSCLCPCARAVGFEGDRCPMCSEACGPWMEDLG